MNTSLARALSPGELPPSADVVVIGAGVNGASIAFQLARRGAGRVVLLERRHFGAGATGKSGALVRAHYPNRPETQLTLESLKVFKNWGEAVGHGDPGFEANGFLRVAPIEAEKELRASVAAHQELGVETTIVSADELREIEPLMRTDDLACAVFEPGSGFADPVATLYGFVEAAAELGVSVHTETEATRIVTAGEEITAVETNRGAIATERVVLAGGAWANSLLAPLGIDLGLVPRRVQVAVFRWPPEVDPKRRHRTVIDSINHSWFRPEGTAGTLIGVEFEDIGVDPDGYREAIDEEYIDLARQALAIRFPVFANATMRGSWSGIVMQSPDSHPIIGKAPGVPGLWLMVGDSGTSFKTAPAVGVCLAEWITTGSSQLVDLSPFRASRFAEGQPWVDEFAIDTRPKLTISR
jgi:glycine/D-amino acid oxidase-like deaminating enzyme